MKCPFCKEKETSVLDSRPTEDGGVIRRRRICGCERKERFTTFEKANKFKIGDTVSIEECRPLSKFKTWAVVDQ